MPTDKPRFTVILDKEVFFRLEEYWHLNHYGGRNQAVNDLLRSALTDTEHLAPDEQRLVDNYRKSENIAKSMVQSALTSGLQYANMHMTHRKVNVQPLDVTTPAPYANYDRDSVTYGVISDSDGSVQEIINEKRPTSSSELTGQESDG